ncbi:MAG TPA: nuclear transport factor 2 family protein [Actinomycetota bacterium]|nr:nuclear transport factor 2 family protein [Actinomycetota bacterium]
MIRRGFAAFGRGDLEEIQAVLSPGAVWHVAGRSAVSGTVTGVEAILAHFMSLYQASGFSLRQEVHDVVGGDAHTVALIHEHAERDGAVLDIDEVLVAHIEGGRVTEAWAIPGDQHAFDEFFA